MGNGWLGCAVMPIDVCLESVLVERRHREQLVLMR